MAKASMHFAYYLFLLTFCIDEGDGRWKKTDRENLQRDIKLYKKITERVEHELQEYYAEYEDRGHFNVNFNKNDFESNIKIRKNSVSLGSENGRNKKNEHFVSRFTKTLKSIPAFKVNITNISKPSNEIVKSNTRDKALERNTNWPKFEDMLLAIGKKYDWKNDRWIKVREKFKIKDKDLGELDNNIMFHEKHRFSYRTIKLNRGKNKRNVVIAVTAIR